MLSEKETTMKRARQQRGFTLTEILVAVTIFTIIMLAALAIYNQENKVFKSGVESTEMQQNTRVGFDKLVNEVRMEGFDFDRDGIPSGSAPDGTSYQQQPDEQIEYMGPTAITFRSNLNFAVGPEGGRETAYEASGFPVVTTANNEIVTYALRSADATKNTDSITFYADTAKPRTVFQHADGTKPAERLITIKNVDLSNANPPYTLYRFTLPDVNIPNNTIFPTAGGLALTETPIANNIRSLNFTYYSDNNGTTAVAPVLGVGQYDSSVPSANIVERKTRASVQSVLVQLVGMNEAPDPSYTNPADPSFPRYREYTLQSLVTPRNIGKRGIKEQALTGPGQPVLRSGCYGPCAVPYFTWDAPTTGNVEFYTIIFDTDPAGPFVGGYPVGDPSSTPKGAFFPRPLDPTQTYYFKIMASNGYGSSISADYVQVRPIANNTPSAPTGTATPATTTQPNQITVSWNVPSTFAGGNPNMTCVQPVSTGTTGVPATSIPSSENIAYRIYRYQGNKPTFQPPSEGTLIASETLGNQPAIIGGVATFVDIVPACTDFYYRVQAVAANCVGANANNASGDLNTSISDFSPALTSNAWHGVAVAAGTPATPTNVSITPTASCPAPGTTGPDLACNLTLTFDKVTADTTGKPLAVDSYIVQRTLLNPAGHVNPTTGTAVALLNSPVTGVWNTGGTTISITDSGPTGAGVPLTDSFGQTLKYRYDVIASSCTTNSAAGSYTFPTACYFSPSPTSITATGGGSGDSTADPFQMGIGDSIVYTQTGMTAGTAVLSVSGTTVATYTLGASPAGISWPAGMNPGTIYQIDYTTRNSAGCTFTRTKFAQDTGGLCSVPAVTFTPSSAQTAGTGTTAATPWRFVAGDKITAASGTATIVKLDTKVTDVATGTGVAVGVDLTSPFVFTWPATLTNNRTYRVDMTVTDATGCQTSAGRFVQQYCPAYAGGTATLSSTDAAHTGLTNATAWLLQSGNTITVTEAAMRKEQVTFTDLTVAGTPTVTNYSSSGSLAITWPATLTTGHLYQVDIILYDSSNCASTTYTRFVTQYCSYKGGAPYTVTISASSSAVGNTGATSATPAIMVPNVDTLTISEPSLNKVYIDYVDTSTSLVAKSTTATAVTVGTVTLTNPIISGGNGKTYKLNIKLEDASGCQTPSAITNNFYIKQKACLLTGSKTVGTSGGNGSFTISVTNSSNTAVTVNSIYLTYGNIGPKHITTVTFPVGTAATLNSTSGPTTVTVPSGNSVPANGAGAWTFVVNADFHISTTDLTDYCVTYTTATGITQSCNVATLGQESANPASCQ